MQIFELAFRLGIIIAIFSFIWGIIKLGLRILRQGSIQSIYEAYFLKSAKYILLSNVIILNDFESDGETLMMREFVFTILILLMYFVGNMQKKQERNRMFSALPPNLPFSFMRPIYHPVGEIVAIVLGIGTFVFFAYFPTYAFYGVSEWFYQGVISLENAFLIGFIFKVIGFFFLVNIIRKMLNSVAMLLTGKPMIKTNSSFYTNFENHQDKEQEDDFDDYEEIK